MNRSMNYNRPRSTEYDKFDESSNKDSHPENNESTRVFDSEGEQRIEQIPSGTSRQQEYDGSGDYPFTMTPDMKQAMRELEVRENIIGTNSDDMYDDYDYDDTMPEYDVKEKLDSLNAQLANEPDPPDPEHRNSKVVFREELVSLVAPPPEMPDPYDDEDEEEDENEEERKPLLRQEEDNQLAQENSQPIGYSGIAEDAPSGNDSDNAAKPKSEEPVDLSNPVNDETKQNQNTEDNKEETKQIIEKDEAPEPTGTQENIQEPIQSRENEPAKSPSPSGTQSNGVLVVSRNGEYNVMGDNDMVGLSNKVVDEDDDSRSTKAAQKPPNSIKRNDRPTSAPANKSRGSASFNDSEKKRRQPSAMQLGRSSNSSQSDNASSQSKGKKSSYDNSVPRVNHEALRKQQERQEKQDRERRRREKEEQEQKRRDMDQAFKAWKRSKDEQEKKEKERQMKFEAQRNNEKDKMDRERKEKFEETEDKLKKIKEEQRKREEKMEQYRMKEMEEGSLSHTNQENQRAFKTWLKKKQREQKQRELEEKHRARVTRLAMRQCRKSQSLAQAISDANVFRYLDLYGYP